MCIFLHILIVRTTYVIHNKSIVLELKMHTR
jgi:hypothetical protein